jgi:predicted Rossmann-fold nucleotide-binding protein
MTWTMLGIHAKPVGLLSVGGYYDALEALLDQERDQGFLRPEHRALLISEGDAATLVERLTRWEPVQAARWTPPVAPPV